MAGPLRRGFKADAERISAAVRQELDLTVHDRLDCLRLAHHFEIPVVPIEQLAADGASRQSIERLRHPEAAFSALTVADGPYRLIVFNPGHPPGRRANSLAHELSHVMLEHPMRPAFGDGGCRRWDDVAEHEADWLAGALLVPRDGALAWMVRDGGLEAGARHFGVSYALFSWRVNQTGIQKQVTASRRRLG